MQDRLSKLRKRMQRAGIDAYLMPMSDFHGSDALGERFQGIRYLTGFTGSAGTLVVTPNEAALFTDGRYFLQAAQQLANTGVDLYCLGEPGVPTAVEFLLERLQENGALGFDGRALYGFDALLKPLEKKGISFRFEEDLLDGVWTDRPKAPLGKAYFLDPCYAGEPAREKLKRVRQAMAERGGKSYLIAAPDDIGWLLNLRGADLRRTPLALCYLLLELEHAYLFLDRRKTDEAFREHLTGLGVELLPYESVWGVLKKYAVGPMLLDPQRVSYALYHSVADGLEKRHVEQLTMPMKWIKNAVERNNLRKANVKDGVAMVRFLHWLKRNVAEHRITERTAAERLEEYRREQGCVDLSFDTICAYGPHGAIVHYCATPETDAELAPKGLLLLDSGGQYLTGTTDVTRTIALGRLTKAQKRSFTLVLKGMIGLARAKFPEGCTGANLDALARGPLWQQGLDYNHGTGHGIGYFSCVHQDPYRFVHYRQSPPIPLLEGMVGSDEPGVYFEGSYGVRIENDLLVKREADTPFGRFLAFETLTLCPIDLTAVDAALLNEEERAWLNGYHKRVFEALAPHLEAEEAAWLKRNTREI